MLEKNDESKHVACFDGSLDVKDSPSYHAAKAINLTWAAWRLPVAAASGPQFRGYRSGAWGREYARG